MSIWSAAVRHLFLSAALLGGLAACGGGGDGDAVPAPRPTALPANLVISAPNGHIAIGDAVTFAHNASDPDGKLTYVWQFGDGSSSVGGMPVHAYARSGLLRVQLTVTNEAGVSTTASTTVAITDTALVEDKSCTTFGGWCWQRPLPQGNLIHDTAYVDTLNGWAVGEAGTLLSTHDAGVTWQARRSGTELALTRVVFVDAQTGWIASTNGQLLKTSDGGATWQAVSIGTAESIQSLGASDARTAWVTMSSWSGPLVTTDGGAHWSRISVPATYSVQRYVPASASVVWAVGYGWNGSPSLMRTADAGASWSEALELPVLEQGMSRSIGDLQVAGSEHAWLVSHESGYPNGGNSYVTRTVYLRTVDGGATWQAFAAPIDNVSISMQFTDANNGIAGAGWGSNAWCRTSDGGATWSPIPTPVPPNGGFLTQLRALAAQVLEFKDSQGQIYLSTDGGIHWAQRSPNGTPMPMLNSVWFFDSREGLAIGADGTNLRTSDGGRTWASGPQWAYMGWRDLQFLPDGSAGWVLAGSSLYRTDDKGLSWIAPSFPSGNIGAISGFHFIDATHGWAVSNQSWADEQRVFRSVDGGLSWQPIAGSNTLEALQAVRFADRLHGIALGMAGVVFVTSDGGESWEARPTGVATLLRRVVFVDDQVAVAVGEQGTIVRSTDRGRTWTHVGWGATTSHLSAVRFSSPANGWAVGDAGAVLQTRDGGLTWAPQASGAHGTLSGAYFIDDLTGWLVGDNGTILVTATGGR
jgi:photosystem II stability/assembly factor-like uncharacterized protein